jgi:hypothetical protein
MLDIAVPPLKKVIDGAAAPEASMPRSYDEPELSRNVRSNRQR